VDALGNKNIIDNIYDNTISSLQMKGGVEELDDETEGSEKQIDIAIFYFSEPLPPSGYSPSSEGEKIRTPPI